MLSAPQRITVAELVKSKKPSKYIYHWLQENEPAADLAVYAYRFCQKTNIEYDYDEYKALFRKMYQNK